jgi:hypothetical protein
MGRLGAIAVPYLLLRPAAAVAAAMWLRGIAVSPLQP